MSTKLIGANRAISYELTSDYKLNTNISIATMYEIREYIQKKMWDYLMLRTVRKCSECLECLWRMFRTIRSIVLQGMQ